MESTSINKSPSNLETSRKLRKNTKKLKLLSLKLELAKSRKKGKTTPSKQSKAKGADTTPLKEKERAESPVGGEKEEDDQCDTVAGYLFNSDTNSTISSIHDLLPSSSSSSSSSLLRTALKKGAGEEEETTEKERWVSYSEVVDEVMSRTRSETPRSSLALKLDYEQVMEAWLDKGTLYVGGEPPQTVPDLLHASADVFTGGGGEALSLLTVPEMETTERLWRGHREASLLRYREKRQNRLFSKRIRYQVRKLNAEKRPRVKGRFVKRDDL